MYRKVMHEGQVITAWVYADQEAKDKEHTKKIKKSSSRRKSNERWAKLEEKGQDIIVQLLKHCPDCGEQSLRTIETTEPNELDGEYKEVCTCDECENIVYIVRNIS